MIFLRFLILSFLTALLLQATIYEDAEDKQTSRWKLVTVDTSSRLNNICDISKKSRVIEFQGAGTKHIYELQMLELKNKKIKENEYWLSWEMKFSEDFVIIVLVQSNMGEHYLVYTPGTFNGHMQYGLGMATTNGEWQIFRRNLQEDIAYFDNRIKIVSLKSFALKGNGRIDNIRTMILPKKKVLQKTVLKKPLITENSQKRVSKKYTHSSPVISIQGMKLVELNLGEPYVEEGVSAYDKEDGNINVVSMEHIDSNEVGRYMVLYMATDSHGNIAMDKRYVHIGNVKIEEMKINLGDENKEIDDDYSDENSDISEQEEQIRIWEKELIVREKELAQREKKSNKNWKRH